MDGIENWFFKSLKIFKNNYDDLKKYFNLFWLVLVIYLIKLVGIWLICKETNTTKIRTMNITFQCFFNNMPQKGVGVNCVFAHLSPSIVLL